MKNCFTTKLGRLIDNYIEDGIQRGGLNDGSNKIMTTSIENIYLRSPDMQMLLNLLAEKEGMWSAILILSIFDVDFKNEFKVIHFAVYSNLESDFLDFSKKIIICNIIVLVGQGLQNHILPIQSKSY